MLFVLAGSWLAGLQLLLELGQLLVYLLVGFKSCNFIGKVTLAQVIGLNLTLKVINAAFITLKAAHGIVNIDIVQLAFDPHP